MKEEKLKKFRHLWDLCFSEDSSWWSDMYFEILSSKYIRFSTSNNDVISMLHAFPMYLQQGENNRNNHPFPLAYLSGICTHPDYRGKGVAGKLIKRTLNEFQQHPEGFQYAALIPANESLFNYYEKFGFTRVFDYSEESFSANDFNSTTDNSTSAQETILKQGDLKYDFSSVFHNASLLSALFARKSLSQTTILKSRDFWRLIFVDTLLYDGRVYVLSKKESSPLEGESNLLAYALVYHSKTQDSVLSIFADSPELRMELLRRISRSSGKNLYVIKEPTGDLASDKGLGMIRLTAVKTVLTQFALRFPHITTSFQLVDEVLPANNGLYSLCSGQLTIQPSSVSSEVPSVTIQQLTQALLGYHIENLPALFAEFPSNKPYIDAFLNS